MAKTENLSGSRCYTFIHCLLLHISASVADSISWYWSITHATQTHTQTPRQTDTYTQFWQWQRQMSVTVQVYYKLQPNYYELIHCQKR